jgi:hypothetical protein
MGGTCNTLKEMRNTLVYTAEEGRQLWRLGDRTEN